MIYLRPRQFKIEWYSQWQILIFDKIRKNHHKKIRNATKLKIIMLIDNNIRIERICKRKTEYVKNSFSFFIFYNLKKFIIQLYILYEEIFITHIKMHH